ncbi:hypothetical protein AVEN_33501-1, partial [Araneus ventricosus]
MFRDTCRKDLSVVHIFMWNTVNTAFTQTQAVCNSTIVFDKGLHCINVFLRHNNVCLARAQIAHRRKGPAPGFLISSYFTPVYNREGAGDTYDSDAGISSGVHQQPERPTAWLQGRQVCGYSYQRATKQNLNIKRWQA